MLGLINLSYNKASTRERDLFFFSNSQILDFSNFLNNKLDYDGMFVLSTCNRTDIYFDCCHINKQFLDSVINLLFDFKNQKINKNCFNIFYKIDKVVSHLFKTSSGIDSLVTGEFEIIDQIKSSYNFSVSNNLLSSNLNRLIQKSLEVSKYVRSNTKINTGSTSVSSLTINKIASEKNCIEKNILIVGAGKMSKLSIKHLTSKKFKNIFITNRSKKSLNELSNKFKLKAIDFNKYIYELNKMDIIIFMTSSPYPLLTDEKLKIVSKKITKKLLLIDLSVPRNVILNNNYKNISQFNLDNLHQEIYQNQKLRTDEISVANKIIDLFTTKFSEWVRMRKLVPNLLNKKNNIKNRVYSFDNSKILNNSKRQGIRNKINEL